MSQHIRSYTADYSHGKDEKAVVFNLVNFTKPGAEVFVDGFARVIDSGH